MPKETGRTHQTFSPPMSSSPEAKEPGPQGTDATHMCQPPMAQADSEACGLGVGLLTNSCG